MRRPGSEEAGFSLYIIISGFSFPGIAPESMLARNRWAKIRPWIPALNLHFVQAEKPLESVRKADRTLQQVNYLCLSPFTSPGINF